jgi:hypothetical protein
MRILLSGDSHGDINHLEAMSNKADMFECNKMFVVGDFGWWPNHEKGREFIKSCDALKLPIYFLDGNHEDHDDLDEHSFSSPFDQDGFVQLSDNIFYAPRGFRWEWDNVKFMSMGGAYSIDRNRRTKFVSWFPQEIITEKDVLETLDSWDGHDRIDVLLSHDVPDGVDIVKEFAIKFGEFQTIDLEVNTRENRNRLRMICDKWKPKYVFHGHWHINYSQQHQFWDPSSDTEYDVTVRGLNCNQTKDWWWVLDTQDIVHQQEGI